MVLLCYNNISPELEFDYIQFIANLGIIIVGLAAVIFSYFQFKKSLEAEKRREKREEIRKKLDEFYGPFLQLRKKSDILYDRFQSNFRANDKDFSTLRYLMNGHKFEGNDKKLLEEIIIIGKKCEELIHSKAGLIDDSNLRNKVLPRLTTHFLILRLAFEEKLENQALRFDDLTFPKEIDGLIEKRFVELGDELDKLSQS